jgi:hypothetical protein
MKWAAATDTVATTFCSDTSASGFNAPNTEYTVDGQDIYCPVYAERGESCSATLCPVACFNTESSTMNESLVHGMRQSRMLARAFQKLTSATSLVLFLIFLSHSTDVAGACLSNANYSTTLAEAAARSARMCTANELIMACGKGSGCQHDTQFIWSSQLDPT